MNDTLMERLEKRYALEKGLNPAGSDNLVKDFFLAFELLRQRGISDNEKELLEKLEKYFDDNDTADSYQSYSIASPEGILDVVRPYLTIKQKQGEISDNNIKELQISLCQALYPGGVKHPQQAEWSSMIERVKELATKREYVDFTEVRAGLAAIVSLCGNPNIAGETTVKGVLEIAEDLLNNHTRIEGGEFKLSDGSTAKMRKFVQPKISETENQYKGRPVFAFDIIIEGGKLDHLEFYCYQTGGGGFVLTA